VDPVDRNRCGAPALPNHFAIARGYAIYAITLCARIGVCSVQVRDTVSLTTNDLSVAVALVEVDTEAPSTQMTGFFAKKKRKRLDKTLDIREPWERRTSRARTQHSVPAGSKTTCAA
jgi:hypothetical protein